MQLKALGKKLVNGPQVIFFVKIYIFVFIKILFLESVVILMMLFFLLFSEILFVICTLRLLEKYSEETH